MTKKKPIIVWFRRDLRLSDHPALCHAARQGQPVVPVFLRDSLVDEMGAAPKWRLGLGLAHFDTTLRGIGSRLTFRSGDAERALSALAQEVGAEAVYWTRDYNPDAIARDTRVKAHLKGQGIEARSFRGQLLFEPQSVHTKQGDYYKVYSPFWRAVRDLPVDEPLPTLTRLIPCEHWPATEDLLDWQLGRAMHRGAGVVLQHCAIGEEKALERLDRFLAGPIDTYKKDRDFPSVRAAFVLGALSLAPLCFL